MTSEIPEDIDRIATNLVRADYSGDDEPEFKMYLAIAQALLAERERAARMVPVISGDEGEMLIEWPGQIAISLYRGDVGYTISREGWFEPGKHNIFDEPERAAAEITEAIAAIRQKATP